MNDILFITPVIGIAVGLIYRYGYRFLPAIFILSSLSHFYLKFSIEESLLLSLIYSIETLIGTVVIKSIQVKNNLKLYNEFVAVLTASFCCSLFALLSSSIIHPASLMVYTLSHFLGCFLILPLLIQTQTWKDILKSTNFFAPSLLIIIGIFIQWRVFEYNNNIAFLWIIAVLTILLGIYYQYTSTLLTSVLLTLSLCCFSTFNANGFHFGHADIDNFYLQILIFSIVLSSLLSKPLSTDLKDNIYFKSAFIYSAIIILTSLYFFSKNENKLFSHNISILIENTIEGIKENAADTEDLLQGASGLVIAQPNLNNVLWKNYIESHKKSKTFSVVNGLGVIKDSKDLKIMLYQSPYPTQILPGLELGSDQTLAKAANESKNNFKIIASESTTLLHDNVLQNSFIIFHPIKGNEFSGWIFAPIITESFFNKSLSLFKSELDVHVYENKKEIYETNKETAGNAHHKNFTYIRDLEFYGKHLTLMFFPKPEYFLSHKNPTVPLAGFLITIFLFVSCFLVELFSFGFRAETLVKERTREIEETKQILVQKTKMASLGEMSAGLAHEINNPLTVISGRLQILLANMTEEKWKTEIEKMLINTEKISKIIEGLRVFSGKMDKAPYQTVKIKTLVNDTIQLCSKNITNNSIQISLEMSDDIAVHCRAPQISEVLFHLINNSCDAIAHLPYKWIKIEAKKIDFERVQISVTDSGKGIPKDIADKIMQPFFTTKEVGIGKGMDLSISLGIVSEHKGTLTIDHTNPNTRFVIELPA